MKILLHYLKPYKALIALALFLAAINQVFSMLDPLIFGKVIDVYANHPYEFGEYNDAKQFISTGPRS